MFIKNGATRHVLLTRRYAIKIARITPLHVVYVTFRYVYRLRPWRVDIRPQTLMKKNPSELVRNFFIQSRHHLGLGIKANRAEARYWQETKNDECTPVVALWLWGYILVQKRAAPVTAERIMLSRLREYFLNDPELQRPEQFGFCEGRVRIVDFAHWGDPSVLPQ